MTYEEAIKILDEFGGCCSSDKEYIAAHIAIEAIEKQIPKKPRKYARMNLLYFECPSCDTNIQADVKYCRYCGQALDWSE